MTDTKMSTQESFKHTLEDAILVVERLKTHCANWDEMTEMMQLALQNDGQLNLLLAVVTAKK